MPSKRKKNKRRMRRVAASIPEAPVSAPDQFETHDEPLVKAEVEAEIVAKVQAEVEAVVEPESGPVAAPVVETEEVVIDTEDSPEVEAEVIPMVNADAIPEEVEVEEAPVVTEDEPVTTEAPEEVPVETEIIPETLSEPVVAPVHEAPVANVAPSEPLVEAPVDPVIDTVADNFIITESVPTLEAAMAEPAIEEQVPTVPTDSLEALSESLNNVLPVSEPAPVTADKVVAVTKMGERETTHFHPITGTLRRTCWLKRELKPRWKSNPKRTPRMRILPWMSSLDISQPPSLSSQNCSVTRSSPLRP